MTSSLDDITGGIKDFYIHGRDTVFDVAFRHRIRYRIRCQIENTGRKRENEPCLPNSISSANKVNKKRFLQS